MSGAAGFYASGELLVGAVDFAEHLRLPAKLIVNKGIFGEIDKPLARTVHASVYDAVMVPELRVPGRGREMQQRIHTHNDIANLEHAHTSSDAGVVL
jgi:hypothetical protein